MVVLFWLEIGIIYNYQCNKIAVCVDVDYWLGWIGLLFGVVLWWWGCVGGGIVLIGAIILTRANCH